MKKILSLILPALLLVNFLTAQTTLLNPSAEGGFENGSTFASNGWQASNSTTNPWNIGTAVSTAPFSNRSVYPSSDGGFTNGYITTFAAQNYFWRDVTVPAGQSKIILTFNWIGNGESSSDIFQVFAAPTSVTPLGSTTHPGVGATNVPTSITGASYIANSVAGTTGVQTITATLPSNLAGTTFRLIFLWKNNDISGSSPSTAIDNISLVSSLPSTVTSTPIGGLWSSPATWVGGTLPGLGDNVVIADGATVTVNQAVSGINNLTVGQGTSGVLQWGNSTAFQVTLFGNITVNTGARYLQYISTGATTTIVTNIGGSFVNNGFANLAIASLNFNGSTQAGGSLNQSISGTGTFVQSGSNIILRTFFVQSAGTFSINTSQPIVTSFFAHTAGVFNTNNKLVIDNTAQVYGQPINTSVASAYVTNMGVGYTTAPIISGAIASAWTASSSAMQNIYYYANGNIYLCTAAGTFDASVSPTHTSGVVTNGSAGLLWISSYGVIGNPFILFSTTLGVQYYYGNNLYVCTVAGTPSASAPPTHTSGEVVSGTASFLYVGTAARVAPNFDAVFGTVRSVNILNQGSGYSSSPVINISGGSPATPAVAAALVLQSIIGPTNSSAIRSGSAMVNGSVNINSTQAASAQTGVGSVFVSGGGVNYTVAPIVGFAGPTGLNLVTSQGSGYASLPIVNVSGGTLISGSPLNSGNFIVTANQGKVISVYLAGGTTATYSVPPTLTLSGGGGSGAAISFPAGCWPSATAIIGSNGQILNFNVTNSGYGYVTSPVVAIGATSGTAAGGTFTTVATGIGCRVALYNYQPGNFLPSTANVSAPDDALLPANRKINVLTMGNTNASNGLNLNANLEIFGSVTNPIVLNNGVLNLNNNNLLFSWHGYRGISGNASSNVTNGSITLTAAGGISSGIPFTYQFFPTIAVSMGTTTAGSAADGATITSLTASRTAPPSGSGNPIGTRAYRLVTNTGAVYGTNPTVQLNWNTTDNLSSSTNSADLRISQSASLTGPWTIKSVSSGSGTLPLTGSRTTAITTPGPITPTGDDYFAFSSVMPPPSNDDAPDAILVIVDDICLGAPYTNFGATASAGEPFPNCSGNIVAPVWFSFIAPASGAVKITTDYLAGGTFTDSKVAIFSATNVNDYSTFSIISCDDDGGSIVAPGKLSNVYATGLTAGTMYYVAVDRFDAAATSGDFCLTINELGNSMLSTNNTCASNYQVPAGNNSTYTGWTALQDADGNLVAMVRKATGVAPSSFSAVAQNINTGAIRTINANPYLNRSFRIASTSTNVDVQLFFLNSELAALNAADNTITLSNLGAAKQTDAAGCANDYLASNGSSILLSQNGNGTVNNVSWITLASVPSFSNFYLLKQGSVLPLRIDYINGRRNGAVNILDWKITCTNSPTVELILESSSNGIDFKPIYVSNETQTRCEQPFAFTDINPLQGKNYYRVKVIGVDGIATYSKVITLLHADKGFELISIAPNPIHNASRLNIASAKTERVTLTIVDNNGRVVSTSQVVLAAGSNSVSLPTAGLASGSYHVIVTNEDAERKSFNFVKQ
jgi:hypothetical protein